MNGSKRPIVVLQERDRRLLEELGTMRVIDREQAKILGGFTTTRKAGARLLALSRVGLLKSIRLGSRERRAYVLPGAPTLVGAKAPQPTFAEHQLAINSVYLAVKYPQSVINGAPAVRWIRFTEPFSKTLALIPDGYLEVATGTGTVRAMFLEVDLGTESLPVWQRKTQLYLQLAVSGEFQKIFKWPQFRVLVVVNTEQRLRGIRSTVAEATDKIFWFTALERINRDGLWNSIWLRPAGDQRLPLL